MSVDQLTAIVAGYGLLAVIAMVFALAALVMLILEWGRRG